MPQGDLPLSRDGIILDNVQEHDIPTVKLGEFCRSIGAEYMRLAWHGDRVPQKEWVCGIESYNPRIEAKAWGFSPQKAFSKAVFQFLELLGEINESAETDS